jgi:hypothetical protein
MLASLDCRSENVAVEAVIVPELKLRDVQRHVFGADFVERADDTAFEDAPEAFKSCLCGLRRRQIACGCVKRLIIADFSAQFIIPISTREPKSSALYDPLASPILCAN